MSPTQHAWLDRRRFLSLSALAVGGAVVASDLELPGATASRLGQLFKVGVASGDPLPDGVVLWTRLAPEPLALDGSGGMPPQRVRVRWEVAEDPRFRRVVRSGAQWARPEWGHSVHVEVGGLRPDREYWYRFRAGDDLSPVGRTRTAPAPSAHLRSLAFAFVSCQAFPDGFFTGYDHLAKEEVDFVIHLGDYIYEGAGQGSIGRGHLPAAETFSLTEYRVRYGQYKLDPALQAAHAAAPFIVAPDDHDVENNWAGDHSQPDSEPDQDPEVFRQRRAAAFQAYYENLPLRRTSMPRGPEMQVFRRLGFGDLAQLNVLDTRRFRTVQIQGCVEDCAERHDHSRTMLGAEQEEWLLDGLGRSRSTWNILGNQIFCFQADHNDGPSVRYGMDTWDGYAAARQRLFDGVVERRVDNFVLVTGDAHRSVAADLKLDFNDTSSRTVGTEFLGTSLSSGGNGADMDELGHIWLNENPHMRFHNSQRGYQVCHLTKREMRTDYKVVPYVNEPGAPVTTRARVYVEEGRPGVAHVES